MQNATRRDNLSSRRIGDELVIYDVARSKAHRLNQTTALIWRHCDGSMSVPELAQLVSREFGIPASEDVVWLALDQLDRAKLLQTSITRSPDQTDTPRAPLN